MGGDDSDSSGHDSSNEQADTGLELNIAHMAKELDSDMASDSDDNEETSNVCMYSVDTKGGLDSSHSPTKLPLNVEIDDDSEDDEYSVLKQPKQRQRNLKYTPSTKLEHGVSFQEEVYTKPNIRLGGGGEATSSSALSQKTQNDLMKSSVLTPDIEQKHTLPPYQEGIQAMRKKRQKEKANSKGKNWFDMKAPEMTEEQKNDLKILQMRHALDPKSFYKKNDLKNLPKFFQMGKVVETAADFYSSRIPKKQRKQTLVDELLADAKFRQYNKRKYTEAVTSNSSKIPRGKIKMAKRLKKHKR